MASNLLPCPFCGGAAKSSAPFRGTQKVWCNAERCENKSTFDVDAWNRRATQPAAGELVAEAWRSMDTAPKDGTMLRLLVEFTDNDVEDSEGPHPTIGSNTFEYSDIDEWMFAGWDWQQDQFCKGEGRPIGWLPMEYTAPPAAPVAAGEPVACIDPADLERLKASTSVDARLYRSGSALVPLYATPPAAAHGDEAVLWIECDPSAAIFDRLPKDWQFLFSTKIHQDHPGDRSPNVVFPLHSAMRAQGDGGSVMKGSMSRFSFQHSTSICDICGKPRNRGQGPARHDRCSKIRQQMHAHNHR